MRRIISIFLSFTLLLTAAFSGGFSAMANTTADGLFDYTVHGDESSGYYVSVDKYKQAQSYDYSDVNVPSELEGVSVTEIGDKAFIGAWNLDSVGIPHTVKKIGARAFLGCSFIGSFVMSSPNVEAIGDYAFANCSSLTSFNIPATVNSLGNGVFMGCDDLSVITVAEGNGDYTAENGVLYNADKTKLIKIPSGFSEDYLALPESVTVIAEDAVYNNANSALKTLVLPESVTVIEKSAIDANPTLQTIYYLGSEEDWNDKVSVDEDNAELASKLVFHNEHTLDEGTVITDPTCTEKGSKRCTCSVCGVTVNVDIDTVAHTPGTPEESETKAATCTEAGVKTITTKCTVCGNVIDEDTEEIPLLAHTPGTPEESETKPATCTEVGVKTITTKCTVCGAVIDEDTEEIPLLAHTPGTPEESETKPATCTEVGVKTITTKCTVCGNVIDEDTEEIPMLAHTPGTPEESETKPATCTEAGVKTITTKCTVCGAVIDENTEEIPVIDHSPAAAVRENYVAPTFDTQGGYDMVVYCSACGAELSREHVTLEPVECDHPSVTYTTVRTKEPTCAEAGCDTKTGTCEVCGIVVSEERIPVDTLPHTPGTPEENVTREATCTEAGVITITTKCAVCGNIIKEETEEIPVIPHTYDDGDVTTDPTCTEPGEITYTCINCGSDIKEGIAPLGHTSGEIKESVVKEPTCTNTGVMLVVTYCRDCKTIIDETTDEIPALGHSYAASSVTAPSCTKQGYTTYACSRCGVKYNADYVQATGHNFSGNAQYCLNNCGTRNVNYIVPGAIASQEEADAEAVAATLPKIKKQTAGKNSVKIIWNGVNGADGYELQYSTNKKFKKKLRKSVKIKNGSTTRKIVKKLKRRTVYYFRIRAYKLVNGRKVYSKWSKVKKIKTK